MKVKYFFLRNGEGSIDSCSTAKTFDKACEQAEEIGADRVITITQDDAEFIMSKFKK